jgi:hypothetical protein
MSSLALSQMRSRVSCKLPGPPNTPPQELRLNWTMG